MKANQDFEQKVTKITKGRKSGLTSWSLPLVSWIERYSHRSTRAKEMRGNFATDSHRVTRINAKLEDTGNGVFQMYFISFARLYLCDSVCICG